MRNKTWETGAREPVRRQEAPVHLAIVYAADGVRFVTAAQSREAAQRRLAGYVAERAELNLWPPDAERVRQLMLSGCEAGAIETYFRCVGERWDLESLHRESVCVGGP